MKSTKFFIISVFIFVFSQYVSADVLRDMHNDIDVTYDSIAYYTSLWVNSDGQIDGQKVNLGEPFVYQVYMNESKPVAYIYSEYSNALDVIFAIDYGEDGKVDKIYGNSNFIKYSYDEEDSIGFFKGNLFKLKYSLQLDLWYFDKKDAIITSGIVKNLSNGLVFKLNVNYDSKKEKEGKIEIKYFDENGNLLTRNQFISSLTTNDAKMILDLFSFLKEFELSKVSNFEKELEKAYYNVYIREFEFGLEYLEKCKELLQKNRTLTPYGKQLVRAYYSLVNKIESYNSSIEDKEEILYNYDLALKASKLALEISKQIKFQAGIKSINEKITEITNVTEEIDKPEKVEFEEDEAEKVETEEEMEILEGEEMTEEGAIDSVEINTPEDDETDVSPE